MLARRLSKPAVGKSAALSTPRFQELVQKTSDLARATELFDQAISSAGAVNHLCSRLVLECHAVPLFGEANHHCVRITTAAQSDMWDIESPLMMPPRGKFTEALLMIPVPLLLGDPLIVSIGFDEPQAAVDRSIRARLHGLSVIYAHRALTLWEIEEDIETSAPLTLKERIVFALLLSGYPQWDIAQRMECSLDGVSAHIENATVKMRAADTATAVAMAARRGWLHLPTALEN